LLGVRSATVLANRSMAVSKLPPSMHLSS
jgi:hypothetical protein